MVSKNDSGVEVLTFLPFSFVFETQKIIKLHFLDVMKEPFICRYIRRILSHFSFRTTEHQPFVQEECLGGILNREFPHTTFVEWLDRCQDRC